MTTLDRVRVLLSAQRALLGAVTPQLRAVDVSWNDCEICVRFTVDTATDYDMDDIANEVEGEIEADFLPVAHVTSEVMPLPCGASVPVFNRLAGGNARVFARREI